jgi:RNA polymerase sigma-70 factor (ECF subfamily)
MDPIDQDLLSIERIQRGEEAGLVELMQRHRESLYRFIYRYVANEADAAELIEETFFRVYQKADSFRPKAKVITWMFTIAGNLCRDFIRKNRKRQGDFSLDAQIEVDSGISRGSTFAAGILSPSEHTVSNEGLKRIEEAIFLLPHKLKFPFIFCVLEGNSHDACAGILKTSRKTVETRIYRARKLLQEELTELLEKK